MTYEISAELNLKTIIAESREVAQALNEFADRLTEIDEKYSDERKDFADKIRALPSVTPQPCEDAISRKDAEIRIDEALARVLVDSEGIGKSILSKLPSVNPQEKIGHCKDCKYFEYDSVAKVDGIPLIVAHEICNKWGDGCKTKEDGYCFLFEPQESEKEGKEG